MLASLKRTVMWAGEKVKIKFARILYGSMPVGLYIGNQSLNFVASHSIHHDSITDLVHALSAFLSTDGKCCVTFWDSPSEYEFTFHKDEDEGHLTVTLYPNHKRVEGTGTELIAVTETPANIALPFWRAIKDLESREEIEKYE